MSTKAKKPKAAKHRGTPEALQGEIFNIVPAEYRERLYRKPDDTEPLLGGVIIHGAGIVLDDPYIAEVMLDVGWSDGSPAGEYRRHSLEVLNHDGKNITPTEVVDALRWESRRCYCVECTIGTHLDSPRIQLVREQLELRRGVARANGIALDGRTENEKKIDAILNPTQPVPEKKS